MVLHSELGSDPPIGPDRESGCDMLWFDLEGHCSLSHFLIFFKCHFKSLKRSNRSSNLMVSRFFVSQWQRPFKQTFLAEFSKPSV